MTVMAVSAHDACFVDLGHCSDPLDPLVSLHDHRLRSLPLSFLLSFFSFPRLSAFEMLRALFLISFYLTLVVAHPAAGESQAVIGSKSSPEYQGWFDPRDNGGRFLDVRPRSNDVDKINDSR